MSELNKLDPIFSGQQPAEDSEATKALQGLDPIFAAPIGTPVKASIKNPSVGLFPELGLTPNQERVAAAGAGAIAGPGLQKVAETVFPGSEMRQATAIKNLKESREVEKLLQAMRDEELLRLGIVPETASKGATSGTNWVKNWAGMNKEIAGGVPEGAAAYNRSKGQGKLSGRLTKLFGPLESGQSIADKLLSQSIANEAAAATRASATPAAEAAAAARLAEATPGPLSKAASILKSPIVGGAAAGAGAGLSFYEAYDRYLRGDRSGAVIAALGGAGALASMVPGLGLAGGAVSLAAMPALAINDLMKSQPAAPQPTQQEMQQASRPAFANTTMSPQMQQRQGLRPVAPLTQ
jgi:hypothetical protein